MRIRELAVRGFRNYAGQSVVFSEGLNVLAGANAQGKTNLLEAVYLCCTGRSPRTARDKELIRWGGESAKVSLVAEKNAGSVTVDIVFSQSENKRVAVNGLSIMRIGELMGAVTCVYFSPDELNIVKGAPGERRRFMDIGISQMSKTYFYLLGRYNKILTQRNRLLKGGESANLRATLPVWDEQLADTGARIVLTRRKFIDRLRGYLTAEHSALTLGKEEVELEYEGLDGGDIPTIKAAFIAELERGCARDLKNGFTGTGPHKDDFVIRNNGADLRAFGSQGQQRTAALSLKLAELEIFFAETGEYPVLLLDDVMSELDKSRQAELLKRIEKVQTILACTHLELPAKGKYFAVASGTVTEA